MTTTSTPHEKAAWIVLAGALFFVFHFHLVPALVAGLLVHTLLHRTARLLSGPRLSHGATKLLAAGLLGLLAAGATALAIALFAAFVRGHVGDLPAVFVKMADILDRTRSQLSSWGVASETLQGLTNADDLKIAAVTWLREHGGELTRAGGEAGRVALHAAMGIFVGLLAFFRHPPEQPPRPLAAALSERLRRLAGAFDSVVIAQVEISLVNTLLTAVYLFGILPLSGHRLPFAGTLVAVTFLAGLLPVVGNLVSNTVIVVLSLGVAPWVALASLGFLVGIHKLEYLVNAKIVGSRIGAQAWEILLSIIVLEVAFGISGVVLAPIVYAYLKGELKDRELV